MKANELRIGNLVKHNSVNREVLAIDRTRVYLRNNNSCDAFFYKDINGILITKEWLLKFGLTETNESDDCICYYFPHKAKCHWTNEVFLWSVKHSKFAHPEDEYFCFMMGETELPIFEYVHQLQNIYFALTGEELEIKKGDI